MSNYESELPVPHLNSKVQNLFQHWFSDAYTQEMLFQALELIKNGQSRSKILKSIDSYFILCNCNSYPYFNNLQVYHPASPRPHTPPHPPAADPHCHLSYSSHNMLPHQSPRSPRKSFTSSQSFGNSVAINVQSSEQVISNKSLAKQFLNPSSKKVELENDYTTVKKSLDNDQSTLGDIKQKEAKLPDLPQLVQRDPSSKKSAQNATPGTSLFLKTASAIIPPFYFPNQGGLFRTISSTELDNQITNLIQSLSKEPFGTGSLPTSIPFTLLPQLMELLNLPLYWKQPLCNTVNSSIVSTRLTASPNFINTQDLLGVWRRLVSACSHNQTERFVWLLSRGGQSKSLVPNDFQGLIQDVLETHPGLAFLDSAKEFHSRYIMTVIARIFFGVNGSWSGWIQLREITNSDLLQIIHSLQQEEDINMITQYFSYEHFYVIYCKFWELDDDHDLIINKQELARHGNYSISSRMIDRIFSGAVFHPKTNSTTGVKDQMTYSDFVWFLLAEEDKRNPRSVEYWFRCMDLDGDGVISMYEMEYFYSEQLAKMEEMGIDPIPFEDCLCSMLDMVNPAQSNAIRLFDLKRCKLCHIFFDTFFNLPKYFDHEQRDPFANLKDIEEGLNEISDWDRYAAEAYEALVAEDGAQNPADDAYDSEPADSPLAVASSEGLIDRDTSNANNNGLSGSVLDAMGLELGHFDSNGSRARAALSNDSPMRSSIDSL